MVKLFIICGHGGNPYDPGACSGGYSEADLVRKLASRIKGLGGSDVQVGDTSVNWYRENYIGKGKCPKGVPVLELHMDSATASAKGGHVIIKSGFNADKYDNALAKFIGNMFPGRSNKIVGRYNLANVNRAASAGVNYRLLECCFISNSNDRAKFISQMDELAKGILAAFGIKVDSESSSSASDSFRPYVARVTADKLNIRKGAGTNYTIVGAVKKDEAYTIVGVKSGKGSNKGWGKLKSGVGYVSLDFMKKV